MEYINMDKRFKISKILIGNLIFLLLFAQTIEETSSFGYDSATSCSPNAKQSRRGRAQMLAAIPCDLTTQAYCNLPGAAYPWHAVRRFVHENQGLMKRMYGDVRHISVLRDEIINNEIDVEDIELATDRYSRDGYHRRASKFMHNREDFENYKSNDILREPHFRPVSTTTTTTTTRATTKPKKNKTDNPETTTFNSNTEGTTISEIENKIPANDTGFTNENIKKTENALKSKLLELENDFELTTKTLAEKPLDVSDAIVEDEEDEDVNIEFNSVYETPNDTDNPQEVAQGNIEIVDSPQLGFTNITTDSSPMLLTTTTTIPTTQKTDNSNASPASPTSATHTTTSYATTMTSKPETVAERAPSKQRKPFIPSSQRQRPSQHLHKVDSTISVKLKMKTNPTQSTPSRITTTTLATSSNNETNTKSTSSSPTPPTSTKTSPFKSHLNKNYNRYTTSNNNRYALPTTSSGQASQSLTTSAQPLKPNAELLLDEKIGKPSPSATPPIAGASNKPLLKDSQLFQDSVKQEPATPPLNTRGVNACPVKEEVVAPFWANNTRGEVLALLNLYPFEQYVHWEKCTHEHKQMYCREGCRCEQQYRLHRLLAYDPHNECRGIFSDWFRFPSCCICKCYNIPLDFRATSRSPRSESNIGFDNAGGGGEYRHPIEIAEEQVKNAIYEHATEEWYRPKDEFDFYEG